MLYLLTQGVCSVTEGTVQGLLQVLVQVKQKEFRTPLTEVDTKLAFHGQSLCLFRFPRKLHLQHLGRKTQQKALPKTLSPAIPRKQ